MTAHTCGMCWYVRSQLSQALQRRHLSVPAIPFFQMFFMRAKNTDSCFDNHGIFSSTTVLTKSSMLCRSSNPKTNWVLRDNVPNTASSCVQAAMCSSTALALPPGLRLTVTISFLFESSAVCRMSDARSLCPRNSAWMDQLHRNRHKMHQENLPNLLQCSVGL